MGHRGGALPKNLEIRSEPGLPSTRTRQDTMRPVLLANASCGNGGYCVSQRPASRGHRTGCNRSDSGLGDWEHLTTPHGMDPGGKKEQN